MQQFLHQIVEMVSRQLVVTYPLIQCTNHKKQTSSQPLIRRCGQLKYLITHNHFKSNLFILTQRPDRLHGIEEVVLLKHGLNGQLICSGIILIGLQDYMVLLVKYFLWIQRVSHATTIQAVLQQEENGRLHLVCIDPQDR